MKNCIHIQNPADCCGCGACLNACPKEAITMKEDAAGFIYPAVEETLCVACGKCVNACVFTAKGVGAGSEPEVYAAALQQKDVLKESSSGGVFSALAEAVIDKGGAVFGAAWAEGFALAHTCAQTKQELAKLRGSKYVQSNTGACYRQAKAILREGRPVFYCGTPCQIAGLKAFLGKEYEQLLTADLVCHGVPSCKMLLDDIAAVAGEKLPALQNIKFRDKRYGWGVKGSLTFEDSIKKYHAGSSPYYFYFLKGEVYRPSCYRCRFPAEPRQGDITLGDYWGIRGELLKQMKDVKPDLGVSCVLVNTEKGKQWFSAVAGALCISPSTIENVQKRNGQLTHASTPLPEHETLLNGYIQNGYTAFLKGYKKHTKDHLVRFVKDLIPAKLKRKINDIIH